MLFRSEQLDLLVVVGTAQLHLVSDDTIALLGLGVLGVESDDQKGRTKDPVIFIQRIL